DEVQIFELNENLQKAIVSENKEEVQKVAQQIEQKGQLMGPRAAKKTMLARQVLQELNAGGRVSKKTQLAMEDSARMAEEMPTNWRPPSVRGDAAVMIQSFQRHNQPSP